MNVLDCFVVWSWLLALFCFGMAHLNFTNPYLKYANEAVLPFYILHQTCSLPWATLWCSGRSLTC